MHVSPHARGPDSVYCNLDARFVLEVCPGICGSLSAANSAIKVFSNERRVGAGYPFAAHGKPHSKRGWLATEVRDEPQEKGERDAEKQTGDDWKVEGSVFGAVNNVAGQFPQAERESVPKIKKGADQDDKPSEEDKKAADFARRIHEVILPEGANKSFR